MTPTTITFVLTVLAAVVVVLTRVRLGRKTDAAGRLSIPRGLLNMHTGAGVPAVVLWVLFLVLGTTLIGWVALLFWWVTAVAGLLILARWMPAKGKHSSGPVEDTWGEGPGLSVLAHVGMLIGVIVFTAFLTLGKI
ncbi:MAG: hypothetical protein ACXVXC_13135 [Nocardioidaceae bacterium]